VNKFAATLTQPSSFFYCTGEQVSEYGCEGKTKQKIIYNANEREVGRQRLRGGEKMRRPTQKYIDDATSSHKMKRNVVRFVLFFSFFLCFFILENTDGLPRGRV
jgi:hypothetical protein